MEKIINKTNTVDSFNINKLFLVLPLALFINLAHNL